MREIRREIFSEKSVIYLYFFARHIRRTVDFNYLKKIGENSPNLNSGESEHANFSGAHLSKVKEFKMASF